MYSTKRIARLTDNTVGHVNAVIRDLGIEMTYKAENRTWYVVYSHQAVMLIDHLVETDDRQKYECPSCGRTVKDEAGKELKCSDCWYWMIEVD